MRATIDQSFDEELYTRERQRWHNWFVHQYGSSYDRNDMIALVFVTYMQERYGPSCRDRETGKIMDWGQALARECYGVNWNDVMPDSAPSEDDAQRAEAWMRGNWPDWVDVEFLARQAMRAEEAVSDE